MKVADIEAAMRRTGGRLLKDSDPELFRAELEGGATVQLFSSHQSRSDNQAKPEENAPASGPELTEPSVTHSEVETPENAAAQAEDEDDDWSDEDQDDGTEHCPVCGSESSWGSANTCEHFIGMLFDSSILDCDVLNSLHEAWTELDQLEAHYSEVLLWAIARRRNIDFKTFSFYLRNRDELTSDLSAAALLELARELFRLHIGSLTTTGGMLSGSATTIYAENPEFLHTLDADLCGLANELREAHQECRKLNAVHGQ